MTPQELKAMKMALEALSVVTKEMMAIRDELAEYGEGRPITNGNHQLLWDSSFKAYTETAIPAYAALEKALAEHAMQEAQRLGQEIEQEPVAWRNAAIRVGEDLSSVGPDGYYDMTAQQWLDWAMEQQPHGKNSLAQPEQEPVATVTSETGADITMSWWHEPALPIGTKLYTAPPQRTWVGLNDDEIDYLIHLAYTGDEEFVQTIEAKLKEKNT